MSNNFSKGRKLDQGEAIKLMDQYFERMKKLRSLPTASAQKDGLSARIKFLIQDCLEMRANQWQPRQCQLDSAPKTMNEVRNGEDVTAKNSTTNATAQQQLHGGAGQGAQSATPFMLKMYQQLHQQPNMSLLDAISDITIQNKKKLVFLEAASQAAVAYGLDEMEEEEEEKNDASIDIGGNETTITSTTTTKPPVVDEVKSSTTAVVVDKVVSGEKTIVVEKVAINPILPANPSPPPSVSVAPAAFQQLQQPKISEKANNQAFNGNNTTNNGYYRQPQYRTNFNNNNTNSNSGYNRGGFNGNRSQYNNGNNNHLDHFEYPSLHNGATGFYGIYKHYFIILLRNYYFYPRNPRAYKWLYQINAYVSCVY